MVSRCKKAPETKRNDGFVTTIIEKKGSCCGEQFKCKQEAGCWCATVRLDPAMLAELRARFSDCLCEDCLRKLAESQKCKMRKDWLWDPRYGPGHCNQSLS